MSRDLVVNIGRATLLNSRLAFAHPLFNIVLGLIALLALDSYAVSSLVGILIWISQAVIVHGPVGSFLSIPQVATRSKYGRGGFTHRKFNNRLSVKHAKRYAGSVIKRRKEAWKTARNQVASTSSRTITWVKTNVASKKTANTKSLVKFYESLISESSAAADHSTSRRYVMPARRAMNNGRLKWGNRAPQGAGQGGFPQFAGGTSRAAAARPGGGVTVKPLGNSQLGERPRLQRSQSSSSGTIFAATDSIWQEMVTTERHYVDDLEIAINAYLVPLEEAASGGSKTSILTEDEINSIFGTFRTICRINTELLQGLEKAYAGNWDISQRTTVLVQEYKRVVPFFKMYTEYTNTYEGALETMQSLSTKKKKFRQFLSEAQEKPTTKGLSLDSFLIKPVQRLLKYPLFFKQLVKETPTEDPGYTLLQETAELVTKVAAQVNENTRALEAAAETVELIMRISVKGNRKGTREERKQMGIDLHNELLAPARRLVTNADCILCGRNFTLGTVDTKNMQGKLLVFTDLLILVRVVGSSRHLAYELVAKYDLGTCVVNVESIQDKFPVIAIHGVHVDSQGSHENERSYMVWFGSIDYRDVLQEILHEQSDLQKRGRRDWNPANLGASKERRPTNFMSAFWPVPNLSV